MGTFMSFLFSISFFFLLFIGMELLVIGMGNDHAIPDYMHFNLVQWICQILYLIIAFCAGWYCGNESKGNW